MDQLETTMEMFDLKVRRLQNGNKLRIDFETPDNLDLEMQFIKFRGNNVKAHITQSVQPENINEIVNIEGHYEVFDVKCRRLRNGDKLRVSLECLYTKDHEVDLVKLRYNDCKIFMERVDELPFPEKNEDEEEDSDDDESYLDGLEIDDPEENFNV